jgi:phosphomethylpyrimidine synthase
MSANPRDELRDPARLGEAVTRPYPGSRKLYVEGSRPDLRVAMREILQSPTPGVEGPVENPPIVVYDTSGPYTDPDHRVDLLAGLPAMRADWIEARRDSEALAERS